MGQPDVTVPALPATSALPKVAVTECTVGEDLALGGGTTPMPATPQTMPTQG
jgi:hypothetical protein